MNLLQCYPTPTVDEMSCEEWGNGTERTQSVTACQGCVELRKEVQDLRTAVNLILPMLPLYPPIGNGFNTAAGLAGQTTLHHVMQQSLLRNKRPIAHTPTVPQPECPGQLRTVLSSPASALQNAILMNHLMMPGKPVSPTLPNGHIQPAVGGEASLQNTDEQPVKWSSPSSVDSNGQKTDSSAASAGDNQNIDVIGDGSESPTSSNHSAQELALLTTHQSILNAFKDSQFMFNQVQPQQEGAAPLRVAPVVNGNNVNGASKIGGPERKPRKPVNDDIVKIVRNQDLSEENINTFEIPVPKAFTADPTFRPVSEQQIIQQIIQGKKYEEMEVGECMIQLSKKLAEKRVFGPRLMSQTTVAGLNHSNYSNLPIKGICYIQHVCRKVLGDKFENEEDFWDKFREAMRKLAARCRRVRHAKKTKHNREEAQAEMLSKRYSDFLFLLCITFSFRFGEDMPFNLNGANGLLKPKIEPPQESPTPANGDMSMMTMGQLGNLLTNLQQDRKPLQGSEFLPQELITNFFNYLSTRAKQEVQSPPPQAQQ
ncbi:CRE-LIN-14 protein [Caenorhabditis remanei]|uniref:CRE-LIN-14 protein n=1 Tax=Caenorhabditis remanei TaxID=31234 RepID=E3M222_CAERE|nr:CRE-LIN-14 protein [Caenorhabditis remanei]